MACHHSTCCFSLLLPCSALPCPLPSAFPLLSKSLTRLLHPYATPHLPRFSSLGLAQPLPVLPLSLPEAHNSSRGHTHPPSFESSSSTGSPVALSLFSLSQLTWLSLFTEFDIVRPMLPAAGSYPPAALIGSRDFCSISGKTEPRAGGRQRPAGAARLADKAATG